MKSWCWAGLVLIASLAVGCSSDYCPLLDAKPNTGNLKTETSAPKTVDLDTAKAWYWNSEITVMGQAMRNDLSGDKELAGFIDVELMDKNNNVIDSNMASLEPGILSAKHPSQYKISMWAKTPGEYHVKVVFVDQHDEAAYLGQGPDSGGPGSPSQSGNYSRASGSSSSNSFYGFGHGVSGINGVGGPVGTSGLGGSAR